MNAIHGSYPGASLTGRQSVQLQGALQRLTEDGPEEHALNAGQIDAVIDYSHCNVILLPAARLALRERALRLTAAKRVLAANKVLAALPRAECQHLLFGMNLVTLTRGAVLQEAGAPILQVCFPIDSVICLITTVDDKRTVEVGLVGYEGMLGVSRLLGTGTSSVRALTVAGGMALMMDGMYFDRVLPHCPVLQRQLHHYLDAKLTLARKTAGCNCFHGLEARLARWLMMMNDRASSHEFFLTQEFLAGILGARRESITVAANDLQRRGLIRYARGNVSILDRAGLEEASCLCYARIEGHEGRAGRKPGSAERAAP